MYFYDRIKDKCKEKNITVSQLEKELNFGNGYLSKQTRGSIRLERLEAISAFLDTPIKELTNTDAEMNTELSADEIELIAKYRKLSPNAKIHLQTIVNTVTEIDKREEN